MSGWAERWGPLATAVVVGAAGALLPWWLGGAPESSFVALGALAALAGLTLSFGPVRRRQRRSSAEPGAPAPTVGLAVKLALGGAAVVCGLALVQLIPLPPGLLKLTNPTLAEFQAFALEPLGLARWRPSSMDPPSTWLGLGRFLSLVALAIAAYEVSRLPDVRRALVAALALSAVGIAVVGLGHWLAGAEALFGVHRFVANLNLLTPFGNTNHLAAFLSLGATLGLALAVSAKERDAMLGWGVGAAICALAVVLSLSRGGILTFALTWGAALGVLLMGRMGGFVRAVPLLVVGLVLILVSAIALEPLLERLDTVATVEKLKSTKVEWWPMFWTASLAHWRLGMGLGAFELGFPRFQSTQLDVTFTHPENVVFQWTADLGLPGAALAAVLTVGAWLVAFRARGEDRLGRVVLLALAGLVLHDTFDFALTLNALGPAAAVCVGVALASPSAPGLPKAGAFALAASLLGLAALPPGFPTHRTSTQAMVVGTPAPLQRTIALAVIDRHPSAWWPHSLMAHAAANQGDPAVALDWVNRLLYLRPGDARAHVAAGYALLRLGRTRWALDELRQALSARDYTGLELAVGAAARTGDWQRLVVDSPEFVEVAYGRVRDRPDWARALLDAVVQKGSEPTRGAALEILANLELNAGRPSHALLLLDRLPDEQQRSTRCALLRATVLRHLKRTAEAQELLERMVVAAPYDVEVARTLARLLHDGGKITEALEALQRVLPFVSQQNARAALYGELGALHESDRSTAKAQEAYETASRLEPTLPGWHYRLATLHEGVGAYHAAAEALRAGRRLDPTEAGKAAATKWLEAVERKGQAQGALGLGH